jgi:hypothetical protein
MMKCKISLIRNKDVMVGVFWAVRPGSHKIDEEPSASIFRARGLFGTFVLLCRTVGPQGFVI